MVLIQSTPLTRKLDHVPATSAEYVLVPPPESRNEVQAQSLLSTPRLPSSPPQVMNIVVSCPNLTKTPPLSLRIVLVLSTTLLPRGAENRPNVPTHAPNPCTAHTSAHTTLIIPTTPLPATTRNRMRLLSWNPSPAPYRESQRTKEAVIGAPTPQSRSVRCVPVVTPVHVQDALSTVAPPPSRRTRERPVVLRVRTPDSVHHVLSVLLYLVILISKSWRRVLSILKLHPSWTNGCANSLKGCHLYRLTVPYSRGLRSIPTLPYLIGRLILHLDRLTVVAETAGASRGFAFVSESVSATAVGHGVGKATRRRMGYSG